MNHHPGDRAGTRQFAQAADAEATLRAIAGLAAPEGLEQRVKTVLGAALDRAPAGRSAKMLDWPAKSWVQSTWARGAAAAAIVVVVAGGSWGVYSRVQPMPAPIALPHVRAGGFSSANAMRTPKTLDAPTVTHPVSQSALPLKQRANGKKIAPAVKARAKQAATGSVSK